MPRTKRDYAERLAEIEQREAAAKVKIDAIRAEKRRLQNRKREKERKARTKRLIEIVRYISEELKNPIAADRLAVELVGAAESVLTFPYALPVYQPIRSLKHEYRKILVRNFLIFYWVDEEKKLVTVARVVYAKRDIGRLLE